METFSADGEHLHLIKCVFFDSKLTAELTGRPDALTLSKHEVSIEWIANRLD